PVVDLRGAGARAAPPAHRPGSRAPAAPGRSGERRVPWCKDARRQVAPVEATWRARVLGPRWCQLLGIRTVSMM
ncbi:hypothetical protein ABZ527_30375, partial [Streptomyces griseofuscus]|uniref:hypothetical protein n=1 Tax=Streptomyces griseofuscus TaxID=146922 RepID=UPI0033D46C07